MKRIIHFVLSVCLVCASFTFPVNAAETSTDVEMVRAVELGFGEYCDDDTLPVTYSQFFKMLDRTVQLANNDKLGEWKARMLEARESEKNVLRSEAAILLYLAAETLGEGYIEMNPDYYISTVAKANPDHPVFDLSMGNGDYSLIDVDVEGNAKYANNMYIAEAYYTMFSRLSEFSSKPPLETDGNSARLNDFLTYSEAILATLRLHDDFTLVIGTERSITDADKKIISDAETRKKSILNSKTEVNVKGTKYYVSNSGNDNNDGKSPDKAWASINKLNETAFKPGDGIFFERGGTWRDVFLWGKSGVTYSAYGEGVKPKLFGSPENGADPTKWELVSGSDNIWQYHRKMYEVGLILVNDDENLTEKFLAYWDTNQQKYVTSLDLKTAFSLKQLKNHQFFNDIDLKGVKGGQVELGGEAAVSMAGDVSNQQSGNSLVISNLNRDGYLYFRCDEGNPGSVYRSIEFAMCTFSETIDPRGNFTGGYTGGSIIHAQNSEAVTIDSLCIKYSSGGVFLGKGGTITNCEIAFIGGTMVGYTPPEKLGREPTQFLDILWTNDGPALIFSARDVTVKDNYFHHTVANAYNLEHMLDDVYKNIHINGNLFERCGTGVTMENYFPNDDPKIIRYQDIFVDDNYMLYTGFFPENRPHHDFDRYLHRYGFYHPSQYKNINYINNVFYLSKGPFFSLSGNATLSAFNFSGNTYAQTNGGVLLRDDTHDGNGNRLLFDENAEEVIKKLTGDKNAVVLPNN
jgi:hypothetical protein